MAQLKTGTVRKIEPAKDLGTSEKQLAVQRRERLEKMQAEAEKASGPVIDVVKEKKARREEALRKREQKAA